MLDLNSAMSAPTASNFTNTTEINFTYSLPTTTESAFIDIVDNFTTIAIEYTTQWLTTSIASVTSSLTTAPSIFYNSSISASGNDNATAATRSAHLLHNTTVNDLPFDLTAISTNKAATSFDYSDLAPCDPFNLYFNCTREDYVRYNMGPQTLPFYKTLALTILFGLIFLTGILGNVLVCVVIIRHASMHTATNYYLFSLSVSDLIYLLFGLPAETFVYWHQYPYLFGLPFCKIRAFISEASTYVSVLTIVAFSMERFLAICHPLHLYAMSGFKRALRIIAALWIVSFISAIPFGWMTDIQYISYPPGKDNAEILPESAFCSMRFDQGHPPWRWIFELSFMIFFIIPMILIIILYGKMGAQIRFTTTQQLGAQQGSTHRESRHSQSSKAVMRMLGRFKRTPNRKESKESRHQQSRKAVIRMLAAVVITFFVCWLPFHMQRLWILYAKSCSNYLEINEWLFSFTGFTYYVSCTINPILYNVMSHRYRVAFKDTLCGKRRSVYYNNGFARDQSSFRETTIASSLGGSNSTYDRVHSVHVRSIRQMNNVKDRESIKSNNALWMKKSDFTVAMQQAIPENPTKLSTNVVVVVDNGINGRPRVYTENEAHETLINKNNETCI